MEKDVLEYTEDELRAMSIDELKQLKVKAEDSADAMNTAQLTKKILINSLYGATANKYFPLFNPDFAASITANGRYFIQKSAIYVEAALQKNLPSDEPYTTYGDTDSTDGTAVIKTSNGDITIGDLYDSLNGKIETLRNNSYIKHVTDNISALSCNSEFKTEYKRIKYVMKHRVKKRMYKISVNGKSVIVTKDHSVMVKRNNKLIPVKPFEIQKGDKIIMVQENV